MSSTGERLLTRNKVFVLTVISSIFVVVLLTFVFENFRWHGRGCAADTSQGICNGRLDGNRTEYSVSLSACRSALERKHPEFLCASGPDPSRPEVMTYLAFRNVFYSKHGRLESREVPLSFRLLPLGALFGIISSIVGAGCILAIRTKLKIRQANRPSEAT